MTEMERKALTSHLTDDELFGLALPPAGQPEALPAHLLQCSRCGRALQEWKSAVQQLGDEEVEPVMVRSAAQWRAAEDRTLEILRQSGTRRRFRPLPWAAALAASVLLAILLLPARRSAQPAAGSLRAGAAVSELSAQDAADDTLLREVASLSRGEDGGDWDGLAPDPAAPDGDSL
jgi:hypothetical protein